MSFVTAVTLNYHNRARRAPLLRNNSPRPFPASSNRVSSDPPFSFLTLLAFSEIDQPQLILQSPGGRPSHSQLTTMSKQPSSQEIHVIKGVSRRASRPGSRRHRSGRRACHQSCLLGSRSPTYRGELSRPWRK
ncbi:hypothetical protein PC116_g8880 [Phytophthora cactorum]|nr:hypothetical protein PC114_g23100 [Phytophthora cactorum]KAG4243262.1 hypothetical protein PC116_g8880 [Phytophthora cactorum]